MRNADFFETKDDLFQKSLHGEADFLKGLRKNNYNSIWNFLFASIMDLFIILNGFVGVLFFVASIIKIISGEEDIPILLGIFAVIFIFLFVAVINIIGLKILVNLVYKFIKKDIKFKIKAILFLIIPIILFILTLTFFVLLVFAPSYLLG